MPNPIVRILRSAAELRSIAPAWDDLRDRTGGTLPTARAELVALWCEHFAARQPLAALVIEREGRLEAALPLIERRRLGIRIGTLPGNDWSPAGDLLLDPLCQVDRVCDALVDALPRCDWAIVDLGAIFPSSARWTAFLAALGRRRLAFARRQQCRVNVAHLGSDWPRYFASRSRNHRRHIRRALARAQRQGTTELVCHNHLAPGEVEPLLRTCFEIEAAGWKGRARGAALNVPGVWDFYARQARLLAAAGELNLLVLEHAGRAIAFEYGWLAGDVYYSPKVGYDEACGRLAPGQLLRALWLKRLSGKGNVRTVDFLGAASAATSAWATGDYEVDRVVVALGGLGRAAVELCRRAWPLADAVRRWRGSGVKRLPAEVAAAADESDDLADEPAVARD